MQKLVEMGGDLLDKNALNSFYLGFCKILIKYLNVEMEELVRRLIENEE